MDLKVPHLGDGISSGTVLNILVKPGDKIAKDDVLIELETDKAVAPVPASASGEVIAIHVKEGDTAKVGQVFADLKSDDQASESSAPAPEVVQPSVSSEPVAPKVIPQSQPVPQGPITFSHKDNQSIATRPSVRKIANTIGLNLSQIPGSGPGGRIELNDVQYYIQSLQSSPKSSEEISEIKESSPSPALPNLNVADFSKIGPVESEDVSSLRQTIAKNLTLTWQQIPHVTQFDELDITELMKLRSKYNKIYKEKGSRLTLTTLMVYILAKALEKHSNFNVSYCANTGLLIKKSFINIGVAVDTPSGLVVPVLKDVPSKTIFELAQELDDLAQRARDRKLGVEDFKGSSMTISNLGGFGVGSFTPIVNRPDVAILGLSAGKWTPVYDEKDKIQKRLLMPISMSYDHQIIDGADGARFVVDLKDCLNSFSEKLLKE